MARYDCARCGATCHTTDGEHICKDIAARLRRRQGQVEAVVRILAHDRHRIIDLDLVPVAEAIVKKLSGMGVELD